MPRKTSGIEMKTVLFIDAVDFTQQLKNYDRAIITAKINQLREFADFFFIHKLKGTMIGELGDGFLILCPPEPHRVLNEAFACMAFVKAYNYQKDIPSTLNVRVAIHYGLIAPPEGDNYIDSNINLTSRLEGKTPPNCICVSSVVHDIVSDTLRHYKFEEVKSDLKGFGQSKFYLVASGSEIIGEPSRKEGRLGFYLSTISAFRHSGDWERVRETCKQALLDFKANPEFTYQLGMSSIFLKDPEAAIESFEECVRLNYKVADSLHFIGTNQLRAGNELKAIESFHKALASNPKKFHSLLYLGTISLNKHKYEEAWMWASKSCEFAPRFYAPRAIQVALVIFLKKKRAIEKLIEYVPQENSNLFKASIEQHLKALGAVKYRQQLDSAFKSVYGADWRKRAGNRRASALRAKS